MTNLLIGIAFLLIGLGIFKFLEWKEEVDRDNEMVSNMECKICGKKSIYSGFLGFDIPTCYNKNCKTNYADQKYEDMRDIFKK